MTLITVVVNAVEAIERNTPVAIRRAVYNRVVAAAEKVTGKPLGNAALQYLRQYYWLPDEESNTHPAYRAVETARQNLIGPAETKPNNEVSHK